MMASFCTFAVGGIALAIGAANVTEFGRIGELTPVPLSDPAVAGLVNLRGQIVTVLDIRRCFGAPPTEQHHALGIYFRHDDALFSLIVDAVDDIVELDEDGFEPPPGNLSAAVRDVLVGVHKLPGKLLMIVDADRIVRSVGAAESAR